MRTIFLLSLVIGLLLVAGCTSVSPGPGTTVPATPVPSMSTTENVLPMNATAALGNDKNPFSVSVYDIEPGDQSEPGKYTITIYIAAKNTGTKPIQFVWFSKLTDINGYYYGGIGLSYGGNGARTGLIQPNATEAARDYVDIGSAQDLATLSKGALLDVYFMDLTDKDNSTVSLVPDYHVTWAIDPGMIR
jgi:hypothetical protein